MMKIISNLCLRILLLNLCLILPIFASEQSSQLHSSIGLVQATYDGPTKGSISIPLAMNFEYEYIKTSNQSYVFENIIAIDSKDTKTKYFATHFGTRYYFNSSNFSSSKNDIRGSFSITPRFRYYAGWNLGIAQVVISSLGPVLDAVSTVFEYGAHTGAIYQVGKSWGLETKASIYLGYGFSSITVSSQIAQVFFGGVYYY